MAARIPSLPTPEALIPPAVRHLVGAVGGDVSDDHAADVQPRIGPLRRVRWQPLAQLVVHLPVSAAAAYRMAYAAATAAST